MYARAEAVREQARYLIFHSLYPGILSARSFVYQPNLSFTGPMCRLPARYFVYQPNLSLTSSIFVHQPHIFRSPARSFVYPPDLPSTVPKRPAMARTDQTKGGEPLCPQRRPSRLSSLVGYPFEGTTHLAVLREFSVVSALTSGPNPSPRAADQNGGIHLLLFYMWKSDDRPRIHQFIVLIVHCAIA